MVISPERRQMRQGPRRHDRDARPCVRERRGKVRPLHQHRVQPHRRRVAELQVDEVARSGGRPPHRAHWAPGVH